MLVGWNHEHDMDVTMASDEPKHVPSSSSSSISLRLPFINPTTTSIRFVQSFNDSLPSSLLRLLLLLLSAPLSVPV